MTHSVKNLLNIAIGQIGYMEKETCANLDSNTANAGDGNHTKYARDLHNAGYYQADKCGYAWCDVFVDWCFWKLCSENGTLAQKMTYQSGPYGAGCVYSAKYYNNAGRLYTTNPQPGDQIFFGKSLDTLGHTGIIESVTDTYINTIEGNTGNKVARRQYKRTDSSINCFGRPLFEEDAKEDTTTEDKTTISNTTNYKNYTVVKGDCWWSIADEFLGNGNKMNELAKFNGKTINTMLHPGDILKIPVSGTSTSNNTNNNTNNTSYTTYTVKKGNSWWSIAAKYMGDGHKMNELAAFNGKTTKDIIHPGDVLKIPKNTSNTAASYTKYTVKSGDSWWSIAEKYLGNGSKMTTLAEYNGKTTKTMLHPGDVLKIPN